MTTDERPESLASAAASWVPPWERPPRPAPATAAGSAGSADGSPGESADAEVPDELPPLPGEAETPATVDAPQPGDEPGPLEPDIPVPDVIPVPGAIPDTAPEEFDDGDGSDGVPIDAPVPLDDEAPGQIFDEAPGQIFDEAAADDTGDVDVDIPFAAGPDAAGPAGLHTGGDAPHDHAPEPAAAGGAALAAVPVQARGRRDTQSLGVAVDPRTQELPALTDEADLRAALEAILLVVDQPVAEMQLAQIVEQPTERVATVLEAVAADYTAAGRGFDLRRAAGGWRLYTRPEYAPYVERFVLDGQTTRLTQAALETLAVVAYKQPVTRSRISAIRGVNCDGVMRTLVTRGLIEEVGTEPESGAYLYRTTTLFLEKLGLNSVDQLPALAPFLPDDVEEEFDAQR